MKAKKGFLLVSETLKIIIAVICIGFLVYFLTSLYFTNKSSKDLELAETSLSHLINEIKSGATEVEIYNPVGGLINWFILSWPYENTIPNSCSNLGWSSCVCICQGGGNNKAEGFMKRCDENGVCLESDFIIEEEEKNRIKIKNPPLILTINHENKVIKQENEFR